MTMSIATIPILMYHNVDVPPKGGRLRGLYVLPRRFRLQMKMLKWMGYRGLSMSGLLPYLQGEKSGKVVGITFDDGYRDNLIHALPILLDCGFQATCYIVRNRIGDCNRWDLSAGIDRKPLMDREQIGEWIGSGMEIGSHTLDHVDTSQCKGADLRGQIHNSKSRLEQTFGVAVDHFCYPYGTYTQAVVDQVERAGYHSATTTRRGRAQVPDQLLELPRVPIFRSTLPHLFWTKIKTGCEDRRG